MKNYNKIVEQLVRYFYKNCYLDKWVGISGDRHFRNLPDEIDLLHKQFLVIKDISPLLSDEEIESRIRRMKIICRTIRRYYNYYKIKIYFQRKFK